MKIAFEINHPAQAHLFKNLIRQFLQRNHQVTVFVKESRIIQSILQDFDIPYLSLGKKGTTLLQKVLKQFILVYKLFKNYQKNHFQLAIGVSVSFPLLSQITRAKAIVLDDDDKKATPLFALVAHNFSTILLRPQALDYEGKNKRTVYYQGYHELAYLHPKIFKPDSNVLTDQGIAHGETFFIIRLVALNAHHDYGMSGISKDQAITMVNLLKSYGRVIVTHEIEQDFLYGAEPLRINPAKIHHLMAYARLIISDGQTMCSEAACLGGPSVRINDFVGRISYLEEQEKKWQLTYGFTPAHFKAAISKIEFILNEERGIYKVRSKSMIENSLNVTGFLLWLIENLPDSTHIMQQNSYYHSNFD